MRWVLAFPIAAVLIGAGVLKAADPVLVIDAGGIGAWPMALALLRVLPWLEILLGLALLSELPLRWTAWSAFSLCVGFVVVSAVRLINGSGTADCGCFGVLSRPLDQWHLAGVVVLAALAGGLIVYDRRARRSAVAAAATAS